MTQTLKKYYIGILLVIFGGIVLHAPISVSLSSMCPEYGLVIKSWKEILMIIATLIAILILWQTKRFKFLLDPLILAIITYFILHLILLLYNFQSGSVVLAGLAIDLRYLLFFGLIYYAMQLDSSKRKIFIKIGIYGAFIVTIFSLLQVFLLPRDVLKYIGYSKDTIVPYLLIDQNNMFVRINSTLRGPNPLGAYAMTVLALVTAAIIKVRLAFKDNKQKLLAGLLILGSLVSIWASYSRSAWLGVIIALVTIIFIVKPKRITRRMWVGVMGGLLAIFASATLLFGGKTFISNVILHENPGNGSKYVSNAQHAASISTGVEQMLQQPIGAGIGSTGSASLLGQKPEIIENQYLFIAHEVGWLGLALFLYISITIMIRLYKRRDDWLALGVLASGIGLAVIGLLLPVWVDDTVSIVWWGLAALALASVPRKGKYGKAKID